jgi:hypothetical protein
MIMSLDGAELHSADETGGCESSADAVGAVVFADVLKGYVEVSDLLVSE